MEGDASQVKPRVRYAELDGVRGWAALSVVVFHIFWETFGIVVPGFRNPVTAFLCNGPLAVSIFFVLSGEALSASYFAGGGRKAALKLAAKRYTRLTIPILACCIAVLALMQTHLVFNTVAGNLVQRPDWLGSFLHFNGSIPDMLRYALGEVYTSVPPGLAYNPFLWTMRVELIGSIFVFVVLLLAPWIKPLNIVLAVVALLLWATGSVVACFPVGMLIARARQAGLIAKLHASTLALVLSFLAFLAVGAAYGCIVYFGWHDGKQILIVAAILILGAIFANRMLSDFFANAPVSRFLGKISFPIYLIQFPVFVSLTSWLIIYANSAYGLSLPVIWGIALISLFACILAAVVFEPVEHLTKFVGDRIVRVLRLK